jgi:large subunit ribosomal protein L32
MGLPGHRRTSSHKRRRASHFAMKKINLCFCSKCGKAVLPHNVCGFCGAYDGKEAVKIKLKKAKKK